MKIISAELLEEFDRPIGLCPVIDVDTGCPSIHSMLSSGSERSGPICESDPFAVGKLKHIEQAVRAAPIVLAGTALLQ